MREQIIFSNYIDLALYQAVVELFDLNGLYAFDCYTPKGNVTVDEILKDLKNPDALGIEQLRAYALAVAGSEFETEDLIRRVFIEVQKGDIFLIVAASAFAGGQDRDAMQRRILRNVPDAIEQAIFALLAFDAENTVVITPLIERITMLLTGDISIYYGNPKMFKYLLDFNGGAMCKSELLTLLNNVVKNAADKYSHAISVLKDYGLRILDVYEMAVYLRTKLACFSRGYRKTDVLIGYLKEELAQYFRKWTDLDKEFINSFDGRLESRIYCKANFAEYHEIYGFKLPELSVNILDDVALDTMLEVLSDKERCFVAKYLKLSKRDVRKIGAKFKDWDKSLQGYYDELGGIRGASACYRLADMSISEVIAKYGEDSEECYAKLITSNELENAEQYVECVAKRSLLEFVKFVQRHNLHLEGDLHDEYRDLRLAPSDILVKCNNDYSMYKKLEELDGSWELLELVKNGFCVKSEWDTQLLNYLTAAKSITSEQMIELLDKYTEGVHIAKSVYETYRLLSKWDSEGVLYERLCEGVVDEDEKTAFFLRLSKTISGQEFREWTLLSTCDCLEHWDIANELLKCYDSELNPARSDAQYDSVMCDVIHAWVVTGSPFKAMNSKHGMSALLGTKCEYQRTWFSIAEKKVSDACRLATMDVNYGLVDGVRCWMTPIGLVVDKVNEKLQNSGIPLFGVSDTGKRKTIFVGAPMNGSIYNTFLHRYFYNDETITVKLIKW